MSGSYYFALVGGGDRPLLELEFNQKKEKEQRHLCQLIAHASLDLVEARSRATRYGNYPIAKKANLEIIRSKKYHFGSLKILTTFKTRINVLNLWVGLAQNIFRPDPTHEKFARVLYDWENFYVKSALPEKIFGPSRPGQMVQISNTDQNKK